MKDTELNAEPDYYMKKVNALFLFESKGFFEKCGSKDSYDYGFWEDVFKKKLNSDTVPEA